LDKAIWTAKQKLGVKPGEWHSFQVSWNKQNGFIVYLDGHFFMKNSIHPNKTDRNDITEILLKVALNTIKQTNKHLIIVNVWLKWQKYFK
jgi:hypothetical protein